MRSRRHRRSWPGHRPGHSCGAHRAVGGEHFIEFALADGTSYEEARLSELPAVVSVRREENGYCLAVKEPHIAIPALLQQLQADDNDLARLTTRHASLEDVFVTLTGRHLRDGEAAG